MKNEDFMPLIKNDIVDDDGFVRARISKEIYLTELKDWQPGDTCIGDIISRKYYKSKRDVVSKSNKNKQKNKKFPNDNLTIGDHGNNDDLKNINLIKRPRKPDNTVVRYPTVKLIKNKFIHVVVYRKGTGSTSFPPIFDRVFEIKGKSPGDKEFYQFIDELETILYNIGIVYSQLTSHRRILRKLGYSFQEKYRESVMNSSE